MAFFFRTLMAAASAVVLTLAFTDRWDGTVWFALAPALYLVAEARSKREACWYATVFAWVWAFPSLWFLSKTTVYGAIAAALYTGLWYIAGLLVVRLMARRGVWSAVFGTGAIWCLIEIGRSRIPVFQFPWLLLGHATAGCETLRQNADLCGVYGLSFLIASANAALAFIVAPVVVAGLPASPGTPSARRTALIAILALSLTAVLYGRWRVADLESRLVDGGLRIIVIQGCEYQKLDRTDEEKWKQLNGHLELHARAARCTPRPDLICWGETMVPGVYNSQPYADRFRVVVREYGIPTFCGSDWIHPDDMEKPLLEQRWLNTAFLLNGQAETLAQYAKRRLVPFGEYVPLKAIIPWLQKIGSVTRDAYVPGKYPSPVVPLGGVNWAMNICIEDCHPDLAREAVRDGADGFLNVTNDGWFVGTHEPATHLRGALFRCIETRRPMLRATNTGCSALIDPLGRTTVDPPQDTVGLGVFSVWWLPDPGRTLVFYLGEGWVALLFLVVGLSAWHGDRNIIVT
jgi:apolipoprotein N-acyltransferase